MFTIHVLLKPSLENFEHYFTSVWDECNCLVLWAFFGIAFLWDWNKTWLFPVLWPMFSKSLIQLFSWWVGLCSLPMFDLRPLYGGGNEAMVTFSKGPMHTLPHSVHLTLQQATADPCLHWRLLDTHQQVWVSLFWGQYSFLLGPGAHKVFLYSPRVCFPSPV